MYNGSRRFFCAGRSRQRRPAPSHPLGRYARHPGDEIVNNSNGNNNSTKRVGELERLGEDGMEVMVLGVDAPGFEDLSLTQKRFAYYLYRAAIPGNAIAFKQSHRNSYEIKSLLESIFLHSDGMDPRLKSAVHEYLKFVWIHHGQYHHYTHTKIIPRLLDREGLKAAAELAVANGARIPAGGSEPLGALLARLDRPIFDPDHEPIQTNQSEGKDIIAESAVNYWDPDVTQEDLTNLDPGVLNKLNVRFAKKDGTVVPQIYRIGGLYSREIETISHFLKLALPYAASADQRSSIEALLDYYRTGDEADFRRHTIHWLKSNCDVDYLNGFIEVYLDPRGIVGQFEANVNFKAGGGLIDKLADNAIYFEKRMPWPEKYKRTQITRPVANVVNVLIETGDAGPVSPAAYNLPNYNDVRRDYGSKNVILNNIENTWSKELAEKTIDEFYLPRYRENVKRYGRTLVRPLEVYMHEIIGHGSGQPDEKLDCDPRTLLARVYSALEECRADLVALYHIADPKLIELGAFKFGEQRAVVETAYIIALQGWLVRIDRIPDLVVREAHDKGSQTIFSFLLENGGSTSKDFGVEVIQRDGDFFVRINDLELARNGVGELLRKIQIIKSTGDREGAEELFDRFGTHLNPAWKANVTERKLKLKAPKIKAFVFPRLEPVVRDGELADVTIHYDEDLTAQQLRFSRLEYCTDI